MVIDFRQPTTEDIAWLVKHISLEDKRELLAQGVAVEWAVNHSVRTSEECSSILVDGELVCITGVCLLGFQEGAMPWLLGTAAMQTYPRAVLKYSRILIDRWLARYGLLQNYVDARYHRALKWLTHLGASMEYLPEHGIYRRPFYHFKFEDSSCA